MIVNASNNFLNLELILSWEDWNRLRNDIQIGDRYDGENKVLLYQTREERERAEYDYLSRDVSIYIPEKVLRDARVIASKFSVQYGNLKVPQESKFQQGMNIRVEYPGFVKVIDIPQMYEMILGDN